MDRDRRKKKTNRQQGTVRTWFPVVMLTAVLAVTAYTGVLFFAGGRHEGRPRFLSAVIGKTFVREVYAGWSASFGVVRITCGEFRGSGVVIACDEEGMTIVSAKHLLMYDVRAEVTFAGAAHSEEKRNDIMSGAHEEASVGQVIGYSASYDLGYLYVPWTAVSAEAEARYKKWLKDTQEAEMPINISETPALWVQEGERAAVRTDHAYRELRAGDVVVQMGMSEDALLKLYTGTAQAKEVFINDYNASMLLNECHAEAGMSGGGAFDENGRLVGIIIAGDEQGTVCMPVTTVLAEYRELAGVH